MKSDSLDAQGRTAAAKHGAKTVPATASRPLLPFPAQVAHTATPLGGVPATARARRLTTLAGALLVTAALGVLAAPALALEGYEPATPASFGKPGPGAGQLEAPEGVAVNDETGDVYVADVGNARIDEFEADGKFVRAWGWGVATGAEELQTCATTCQKGLVGSEPGQFTTPAFVAVDNTSGPSKEDVYVSDSGDHTITKFTKDGTLVSSWGTGGQLKEKAPGEPFSATETRGVAVDTSGGVRVYDKGSLLAFTETGVAIPAESFDAEVPAGETGSLALTSSGEMYYVEGRLGFSHAYKLVPGEEPFEIEQVRATAVAVNPANQNVLLDEGTQIAIYTAIASGRPIPAQVFSGEGLAESRGIAASPTLLYTTQHAADNVEAFAFGPLKPQVQQESVSEVGSTTATLQGQVLAQGALTSYFFEYGTTTAYGKHTPTQSAGAGTAATGVAATIESLAPDTEYHLRLVANNANGERTGPDLSFSTFPQGILGLPDGRGYELVSPLESGDGEVVAGTRAAANGGSVAYQGQAPAEGGNGNAGNPNEEGLRPPGGTNEYLAARNVAGWSAADLQPRGLTSVHYRAFSGDLSLGILVSSQSLNMGAPGGETLYSRDAATGAYSVLGEGAAYAGSTPDGAHVLYSTGATSLFEAATGVPAAVNVLPEGGAAPQAVFGAPTRLISSVGGEWGQSGPQLSNVISRDGSRVFWSETDASANPQRLFVTEHAGSPTALTVQLDASRFAGHPGGEARFETASADGSRVFFTDCNQLTSDSTAVPTSDCQNVEERGNGPFTAPSGNDLYEADLATGTLSDLSVDHVQNANVMGVLGASADGSYVYFAAAGALAPGAVPQECVRGVNSEAVTTRCNVYVVHDSGAPQFVAALSNQDWSEWSDIVGSRPAFVAASSGDLVFLSNVNVTGFDAQGQSEIYMYSPGGVVSCLSCNPSGRLTPPGSGAVLPTSGSATFALRDVSADGSRVFFETKESLVPADQNGQSDVYEWERAGAGSCTRPAGCLFVISGGSSTQNSFFVDASETGEDVFFTSRADLVPADRTDGYDLWDARVGATQPSAEPVCSGTGCQGVPPAPPIFSTPSSVTFAGTGNFEAQKPGSKPPPKLTNRQKLARALKQCHAKRSRAKRRACERAARRRYPTGKAKRANTHRRAGR
jgi:hypothetical protein